MKISRIIIVLVMMFLMIPGWIVTCSYTENNVLAAGVTSCNLSVDNDDRDVNFTTYNLDTWSDAVDGVSGEKCYTNLLKCGFTEYDAGGDEWIIEVGALGFPAESYNGTVQSATLYLYVNDVNITEDWTMFIALYKGSPATGITFTASDLANAYNSGSDKCSTYEYITEDREGGYMAFDIDPDELGYLSGDENGYIWFYIMTTNHAINYEPQRIGTTTWNYCTITFDDLLDGNPPILEVLTIEDGDSRDMQYSTNSAVCSENESGIVDSITWESPRCAYADEKLCFDISGDNGTPLELELITESNQVLASKNDGIRSDGHFYWQTNISRSANAFIRVVDNYGGVYSEWGHVSPSPPEQDWLITQCVDTNQYHFRQPMSYFITGVGQYMFVHWKTNIDGDTELADYNLQWWRLGFYDDSVYYGNLEDLAESYFKNIADNNDTLHWRYAIFTPYENEGFEDYDGLAISLNLQPNSGNYGFYVPEVTDNSSISIITPLDSYWYIPKESDGVILNRTSANGISSVSASVGSLCKVQSDLNQVSMSWVDENGDSISSVSGGGQAYQTLNQFQISEPETIGNYWLRVEFSGSDTDYIYTRDLPYGLSESVQGLPGFNKNMIDRMEDWLDKLGWNNPVGHYLVILILMILFFIILFPSRLLRVVIPMLILGLGIIIGWVDKVLIVLLALGAGLTLYNLFRKKVSGGA